MSNTDPDYAQLIGRAQTVDLMAALGPHLQAMGVRMVERRIGKPARFFENLRARGTVKVRDLFATCYVLELDPVELMRETVEVRETLKIRPPRIVSRAWKQLDADGPGLGAERLAEFEAELQERPRQTRVAIGKALDRATREELPQLLGLYGSCYRVESDIDRAGVVLGHAREMARRVRLPAAEADILIRMAYVDLERNRPLEAIRKAEDSVILSARIDDREGEGIGFLTMGILRHYSKSYQESLDDFEAALKRSTIPRQRFSIYQCSAACLIELNREADARCAVESAREISSRVETWLQGKLSWVEARLTDGAERLAHLMAARNALSSKRPADCALVTVEVIEEALALKRYDLAEQEAMRLCTLTEKTGSPRVERAMRQLINRRTMLTPALVTKIRETIETAQARRLSRLIVSNH